MLSIDVACESAFPIGIWIDETRVLAGLHPDGNITCVECSQYGLIVIHLPFDKASSRSMRRKGVLGGGGSYGAMRKRLTKG